MKKLYWVGKNLELRTKIVVKVLPNDNDHEYVALDAGGGKIQMAVF